jgi:hypothetical protein
MATKPKHDGTVGDGKTTNSAANVQQHGFSGETCEIKLFKAENGEAAQQFVGIDNYTCILHRDVWVRVPVEVADHLEGLNYTRMEPDPQFPDDRSKDIWADKPRFPMQRRA